MSTAINSDEFQKKVLEEKEIVLVDFYADWCSPCRMLSPIMDEVSKDHKVYKINVDDEEEIAKKYGIMSIPCVIAFKNGKEYKRSVGLVDKDTILEMFK
jgi:thioredoxin 1